MQRVCPGWTERTSECPLPFQALVTRARPGRKQRPVAAAPGGRPASPGYGLILDLEVVGSDICSKQPLCTWRPESRQESSLRPGDLSLGSVDINFRDQIRSSVEVRSEVLLYPGHPCHLPFSDIRKKFEEKDENKRKQKKKKKMFFGYCEASKT